MFASLKNTLFPPDPPRPAQLPQSSYLATLTDASILPSVSSLEDGSIERFSSTSFSLTFHIGAFREQDREQIGTVTLYVGNGELMGSFLDDVETRIRQLLKSDDSLGSVDVIGWLGWRSVF